VISAPRELCTLSFQVSTETLLAQLQLLQQVWQHVFHQLTASACGNHVGVLNGGCDNLQQKERQGGSVKTVQLQDI
jgi:hypothetical protein